MKQSRSISNTIAVLIIFVGIINTSYPNEFIDPSNNQRMKRNRDRPQEFCDSNNSHKGGSNKLLYHPPSGQCYLFGTRGPCGKSMIFYEHPLYPKIGFCDCDQGFKSRYPCSDNPVRRMIYIPQFKQCYPIFSQGPCLNGFWLNFTTDSKPVCDWNPCMQQMTSRKDYLSIPTENDNLQKFWFYDPKRKSCFKTLERGYCPVGFTLEVTHDSLYPKCRRKKNCFGALSNIRSFLTCRPGSRYSFLLKGCSGGVSKSKARNLFFIG